MRTFGEILRDLMKQRKVSVREVARALGISEKTVQEWVGAGGRSPRRLAALRPLARYFGCSVHYLLFGEEDPIPPAPSLPATLTVNDGKYEIVIRVLRPN